MSGVLRQPDMDHIQISLHTNTERGHFNPSPVTPASLREKEEEQSKGKIGQKKPEKVYPDPQPTFYKYIIRTCTCTVPGPRGDNTEKLFKRFFRAYSIFFTFCLEKIDFF